LKKIIVSVTNDLSTDQRVQKVCNTLKNNNFEIYLIGRQLPSSLNLNLPYKTFRFKLLFNKGFLFYAEYNIRLFFKLLFLKKDILLANDLDTLLPNFLISKIFNKKLVYDSHELYTEVPELLDRPFIKNIWLTIEKWIFPKLKNVYTVNKSIAKYYNKLYNIDLKVIRNFPNKQVLIKTKKTPFKFEHKNLLIYQGAINKGRGLELIIETMQFLKSTELIIVGDGDIKKTLIKKVNHLNLNQSIKFIDKQLPNQLKELTPLANLGLSIEENLGLNYRYALPNKLFDYIQAEIPVLASDLPEMSSIVKKYHIGEIINIRSPKELAKQIEEILGSKHNYIEFIKRAKQTLTWENEEKKLIEIYNKLLIN